MLRGTFVAAAAAVAAAANAAEAASSAVCAARVAGDRQRAEIEDEDWPVAVVPAAVLGAEEDNGGPLLGTPPGEMGCWGCA